MVRAPFPEVVASYLNQNHLQVLNKLEVATASRWHRIAGRTWMDLESLALKHLGSPQKSYKLHNKETNI